MRTSKILLVVAAISILSFNLSCGPSPMYSIKSSRSKALMGKSINLPYASVVKYFGFVSPSVMPEGKVRGGKDAYYLYVWVPAAVDEIGVAMYSPADTRPGSGDFVHPAFEAGMKTNSTSYFDTYLFLDRLVVLDAAKIKDGRSAQVFHLAENDDTSEIPANPGGQSYNSLLRAKTETSNISKALVRSVYRIAFTSYRGSVTGSYYVQVGTNVPGVKIAPSLEALHALVNESK